MNRESGLVLSPPPFPVSILYSEKRAAHSQLDGPATAWLIAAVSLCQMTNRVSVAITNLPGGAAT